MQLSATEASRLEALVSAYPRLRLGQAREEVEAILGPPTSTQPLYSKTQRTAPIGTAFEYRVTSHGLGPNTEDILVSIVFDADGRLKGAQPQNVPRLAAL